MTAVSPSKRARVATAVGPRPPTVVASFPDKPSTSTMSEQDRVAMLAAVEFKAYIAFCHAVLPALLPLAGPDAAATEIPASFLSRSADYISGAAAIVRAAKDYRKAFQAGWLAEIVAEARKKLPPAGTSTMAGVPASFVSQTLQDDCTEITYTLRSPANTWPPLVEHSLVRVVIPLEKGQVVLGRCASPAPLAAPSD